MKKLFLSILLVLCLSTGVWGANYGDFTATNAFFWSSIDVSPFAGTDLGSTPYYIEVLDGAGKKATGYIGAIGAGETLDVDLVTNGNFSSDEPPGTAWSREANWTITGGILDADNVAAYSKATQNNHSNNLGKLYKYIYTAVVNSGEVRVIINNGNGPVIGHAISGTFTEYATGINSAQPVFWVRAGGGGFDGSCDDISLRQVTAPPSTAVHIVSSLNGTTRDWASIESGFNPNNIASYQIKLVKGGISLSKGGAMMNSEMISNGFRGLIRDYR